MQKFDLASSMDSHLGELSKFNTALVAPMHKKASDDSLRNTVKELLSLASEVKKSSVETSNELQIIALAIAEESSQNFDDLFQSFGLEGNQ